MGLFLYLFNPLFMKLKVHAFAMAVGVYWGVCVMVCTLLAVYTGYLNDMMQLLVGIYPWYQVTVAGAFIGLGIGVVDGFIAGMIFAWLYNLMAKHCCCKGSCCQDICCKDACCEKEGKKEDCCGGKGKKCCGK